MSIFSFKNPKLFKKALTHRSWLNEHPAKESNERLEFLGDAILEFVVSEAIYKKLPQKAEGFLTPLRAKLVNTKNLAEVSRKIGLGEKILLSQGEIKSGGRNNENLLANSLEAYIGALYLDQGLEKVKKFIHENLLTDLDKKLKEPVKDPKTLLQEKILSENDHPPRYKVLRREGPDHKKHYQVGVFINKKLIAKGEGYKKQKAENEAAQAALVKIAQES